MPLKLPPPGQLLPPIDGLWMDDEAHRYCFHGDWFPFSVTGIVSELSPYARQQIERTKDGPDGWALRGTSVHKILERHLLDIAAGRPQEPLSDDRWREWADPLMGHWLFKDCTVLAVEYQVVDQHKRVAGSFDFLVRTKQGSVVLGDLKTVSSAAGLKNRKPATEQLGAYCSMMASLWPAILVDRCVTLVAAPGECELKVQDAEQCVMAWQEAWERHQAKEQVRGF